MCEIKAVFYYHCSCPFLVCMITLSSLLTLKDGAITIHINIKLTFYSFENLYVPWCDERIQNNKLYSELMLLKIVRQGNKPWLVHVYFQRQVKRMHPAY